MSYKIRVLTAAKGQGFAWNPSVAEVKVGDLVEWRWELGSFITGLDIRVEEVDTATDEVYNNKGFRSGPVGSPKGKPLI